MPSNKLHSSSSFTTTAETMATRDSFASSGERRNSSGDAGYVSARSADALLSDFRATTLQPQCLVYLNELLDELLSTILQRSMGLATDKLKTQAINFIIPPPLGRDAVGEAELELLSWMDSADGRQSKGIQEVRYVSTSEEEEDGATVWPWREAWELMRVMTQSYSTLGDRPPSDSLEKSFVAALKAQGGDVRPGIIDPAALYLTAILEHIAEYILSSLSRVMGHEQGLSQAGPKELHSALCEDEALYGMVKGMKIKTIIERAIQTPRKTSNHPSITHSSSHSSKNSHSSSSNNHNNPSSFPSSYSLSSVANNTNASHSASSRPSTLYSNNQPPEFGTNSSNGGAGGGFRSSLDSYSSNGPISPPPTNSSKHSFSLGRKSTSSSHRHGAGNGVIETRSSGQTYDAGGEEMMDEDEKDEDEREFDDFLRGGKTVKLSLTPQSLKASEVDRESGR
ncbi:hypothetical protein BDY24DRAFT_411461 [Mrakia frigida]|uniref:uncharacterized protein n=1 Tax=Mrakia frigida TaxID=29902 RepID=UPI003FCBF4FC